ncbi:MAG: aspartate--tRNA ligase [Flavobacteriales bacterium]|nr:aspartate--tRNA ligase [Flavobacteriales bacterium]MCW8913200.1 aspartate--tRNA ligase [Flavobacteriales bacterium]MCW8937391.1 aspartate--tRNA ligase [Flavobacteriales bacterium]MCW8969331.1 aspartate--tRNA ligase [Flavobacteriales bacterium]MCW8991250.1 aspartate--tRNA ligase [Flavobacteriales bacterium]
MYRTHTNGELRLSNVNETVTLCGWIQKTRELGAMTFVDLRDRYGITQLVFGEEHTKTAKSLGREDVIQITGKVIERESKNNNIPTGEIEIIVEKFTLLNKSKTPPFTIEDKTDGGEELRMQYRYLDLRRNPVRKNLELRHKLAIEVRKYLDAIDFLEIETPYLIKSTPEGARDFVVPSRMNPGQFYALPQSPQTFKQLLMVSGYDRYYQIVRCFRDEDLRADRQPEFTQIDCEMAFVEQEDILNTFEGMMDYLFKKVKNIELKAFPRMSYADAMLNYGCDKPDIRFGMTFNYIDDVTKNKGFNVFDSAETVIAIVAEDCASFTRKQLDALTDYVKRPQVGAKGMVYLRCNEDGTYKSSVDKFYSEADLKAWAEKCNAKAGDLILVLSGDLTATQKQMNDLRLHLANELGLRNPNEYAPLWVYDFPLLEWDEESGRYHAMHHPFTSPKTEDLHLLETDPGKVRANAYDLVLNGTEIGGGSIRIHDRAVQSRMFDLLGFTKEEAQAQFGFLMNAFEYGAPPHGGIALGFDRLCALFGGQETIRDFIAFPKNNNGRDVMIDAPATIDKKQLDELFIDVKGI